MPVIDDTQSILQALKDLAARGDTNAKNAQKLLNKMGASATSASFTRFNQQLDATIDSLKKLHGASAQQKADIIADIRNRAGFSKQEAALFNNLKVSMQQFAIATNKIKDLTPLQKISTQFKVAVQRASEDLKKLDIAPKYMRSLEKSIQTSADKIKEYNIKIENLNKELSLPVNLGMQTKIAKVRDDIRQELSGELSLQSKLKSAQAIRLKKKTLTEGYKSSLIAVGEETAANRSRELHSIFGTTPEEVKDLKNKFLGSLTTVEGALLTFGSIVVKLASTFTQLIVATKTGITQAPGLIGNTISNYFTALGRGVILAPGEAADIQGALTQQFGTTKVAGQTFRQAGQLTRLGLNSEDAAGLLRQIGLMDQGSEKLKQNTLDYVSSLGKANNIPIGRLYQDLAHNSELIARAGASNAESLIRAAAAAAKLGVNLSAIDNISSNLIDFESSIQSEAQLKALTGRFDIDLSKARQYALSNDFDGLRKEIARQFGGNFLQSISRNRIQQNALQQVLGVSYTDIQRLTAGTTITGAKATPTTTEENIGQSILKLASQVNFATLAIAALGTAAALTAAGKGLGGLGSLFKLGAGKAMGAIGGGEALGALGGLGKGLGIAGTALNVGMGAYNLATGHSGAGIGGLIGTGAGFLIGNAIAPGIGGYIGASLLGGLGGQIGKSFDSENTATATTADQQPYDSTIQQTAYSSYPQSSPTIMVDTSKLEEKFDAFTNALLSGKVAINIDGRKVGVLLADAHGKAINGPFVKQVT